MVKLLDFFILLSFTSAVHPADWRQENGDHMSRNFIQVALKNNVTGNWNYTDSGQHSIFYQSPAVSEEGIVFVPFLLYEGYDLQLRAIASNGSLLWTAPYLVGYSEIMCAAVLLTNAVYNSERNMVVIGWTCAAAFPYYKKHGGLVALNSKTGHKIWRSPNLTDANDLSKISLSNNVAYVSGGFDCWKDISVPMFDGSRPSQEFTTLNPKFSADFRWSDYADSKSNMSQIYAISLDDGSILWTKNHTATGCTSQTKLYPLENDRHFVIFPVELPRNIYLGGKLLAFECDANGSCSEEWLNPIGVCYESTFAFSNRGILFGGTGFDGDPYTIFAIDVHSGKTKFRSIGYCIPGSYPSGPAVDESGHAYYNCGNRVFAVNETGQLVWKTDIVRNSSAGYTFNSYLRFSPAIIPRYSNLSGTEILVVVDTHSTRLFALCASNGTVISSLPLAPLLSGDKGLIEPPIVAGNRLLWMRSENNYLKSYLFSIPVEELFYH